MGWVVCSDAVLESRDTVLIIVVTASRCICDAVSSHCREILEQSQQKYTVTEKERMVIVFAFDKFQPYMILSKTVIYTDHSALRHLFKKQDAKPRLICWIMLLQEFDIEMKDKKGTENVAAYYLSRIENDETSDVTPPIRVPSK
ncbi:reverse transcriptase domain-containing protein [Tanacetum coccineum]